MVGATFGAGAQWVAGALGTAEAATTAATAATTAGAAASSPAGQQIISQVVVAGSKLEYILSQDPGKAKGFAQLGYTLANKEALQQTLTSLGQRLQLSGGIVTEYGTKFEQVVELTGPNGALGRVTIIWQIDKGSDILRFITAIPEPFK